MPKSQSTSWGSVADWYDDLLRNEGTFQKEVILPNLLRRMELTTHDHVLDLACGQGFFSVEFSKQGAVVIGSDLSHELIAIAKRNIPGSSKGRLSFHEAPGDNVSFVKDGTIDHVTIVLAIQNIENVKDVFAECFRVLTSDGTLHLVLNHPAFRVLKASEWGWDDTHRVQYRRVDRYLSEQKVPIQMHPGDNPGETTLSFHRPLQYFFKMLAKKGFCVSGLEEWVSHKRSDSGPRAKAENRARAEIPLFLYLEACKKDILQ